MKDIITGIGTKVRTVLRQNFLPILIIHLIFTALGFILFTPLLGGLGQLMLHVSSREVLADTDILFFLLSPYGMAALILFGALLVTILIFEQASMMTAYIAASSKVQTDLIQTLTYTAHQSLTVFKFSIHLVVRLLIIILPFLAIAGLIYWLALTDYDINYYLSTKPPVFFVAAALIGIVVLIMIFVLIRKLLSWSLTLPLILFADKTPAESFKASVDLVKGNKKLVGFVLVGWGVSIAVLEVLIFGLVHLLTRNVVPLFYGSMNMLLLIIGFLVALWSVGNFVVTTLASASLAGLLIELSGHFGQPTTLEALEGFSEQKSSRQLRLSGSKLIVLGVCSALISLLVGIWLVNGVQLHDDLTIVAHRGAAGKAPENTMASIKMALEDKTDWVEIDVQETVDGHVVVVHDSDFMKLSKVDLKVWDGTLEQIQEIDVGSWFSEEFSTERVPTLADVLNESKGKAKVVIELKYYGHDQQLEQRVVDIVEQAGMVDDTAIMSLKYEAAQKVRKLRPDWQVGLLSAQVLGDMGKLDVDFLAVNMAMAKPSFIRSNQAAGKQVFVWTVNDKMSMFRMMSLGIDGIITDEPALARQVIAERSELNSVERLLIHTAVMLGKPLPQKAYRDNSP